MMDNLDRYNLSKEKVTNKLLTVPLSMFMPEIFKEVSWKEMKDEEDYNEARQQVALDKLETTSEASKPDDSFRPNSVEYE